MVIAAVVLLTLNRQRVFLRDPLGTAYRNNVEIRDTRIYINYSNDVVVESLEEQRLYIVQNWNKIPGTPKQLHCVYGMMCWTDADHAEAMPLGGASYEPNTQMSDREVSFNDGYGIGIRVTLR
jgi:hypothetical protein